MSQEGRMELDVQKLNDIVVVRLPVNRLEVSIAQDFKNEILKLIEKGHKKIVLDMENVRFIDSSGLGCMVSCLKSVGGDGDLKIANPSDSVQKLLKITKLNRIFNIYSSTQQAIEEFGQ